jgi:hypothetical protein
MKESSTSVLHIAATGQLILRKFGLLHKSWWNQRFLSFALKVCSDQKKPNGQFELAADVDAIADFVRSLPIRFANGASTVDRNPRNFFCHKLRNKIPLNNHFKFSFGKGLCWQLLCSNKFSVEFSCKGCDGRIESRFSVTYGYCFCSFLERTTEYMFNQSFGK